jgi:hypothetical protein
MPLHSAVMHTSPPPSLCGTRLTTPYSIDMTLAETVRSSASKMAIERCDQLSHGYRHLQQRCLPLC